MIMNSTNDQIKHSTATDGKPPVSSRTFQGFDEDGLLKITAKARTMDEAIQTAYDIFGDKVTIWNFRWLS